MGRVVTLETLHSKVLFAFNDLCHSVSPHTDYPAAMAARMVKGG